MHWVVGTATERVIPFGAFRALLADADITDAGRPAELLRAAQERLTGDGGEQLFVVDDAHHLDHLSATLVYQLALSGSARLIVTVRADTELPDAVAALWADELLTRIEVEPLDEPTTAAVLESALGRRRMPRRSTRRLPRSQGNPLYLRHLVRGSGDLAQCDDHRLHSGPDRRLPVRSAVAGAHGAGLPGTGRAAAAQRPDGVGRRGRRRPSRSSRRGRCRRRRDGLPGAPALHRPRAAPRWHRTPRGRCARRWSNNWRPRPSGHVGDQLRLAALAVESDTPSAVADIVAAAQHALRLGELALAEQLAQAALDRSGGLPARLPLAYALAWQGRGREADAVLAAVDPDQLSQSELMAWALPRAANQFWMLSEPERATAFLQTTRNRVSAPTAQATLDALTATFAMNAGTPLRTLRIAGEVLASPHADEVAVGWAASAAALSSARTGRFDDVDALARRATAADHPGLLRFTSGFGRITALVMAGRLTEARALAQRYTDFAELQQPGRAIGETLVGYVAIAAG